MFFIIKNHTQAKLFQRASDLRSGGGLLVGHAQVQARKSRRAVIARATAAPRDGVPRQAAATVVVFSGMIKAIKLAVLRIARAAGVFRLAANSDWRRRLRPSRLPAVPGACAICR